jgi:hypothetical protein
MSVSIVVRPFEVYVANVGTTFPAISAAPGSGWTLISSSDRQDDDGLTITISQNVEMFRGQNTGPLKAWRTEETVEIEFNLADFTAEVLAAALGTTVTTGSGEVSVAMFRGITMTERALLIRGTGASPYDNTKNAQYEIPRAVVSGEPELVHSKSGPVIVKLKYTVIYDATNGFGRIRMAT